jgi:TetR/AcrR family transcriptional regulator, mexJK operon transcriptional repressor
MGAGTRRASPRRAQAQPDAAADDGRSAGLGRPAGPGRPAGEGRPSGEGRPAGEGRSARKRRAIIDAADTLFLRHGYQGTSMDEIAALAEVSKQTVYKNFPAKEGLFTEIVLRTLDQAGEPFREQIERLRSTSDLPGDLRDLARQYLGTVMQPRVLQLRRLVIGEASRLPALAEAYYQRAPERTITVLADCFQHLSGRGLLDTPDPPVAASHFAFLILGRPLDRSLFCRPESGFTAAELTALADAGTRVFLAAYAPAG